MTRPNPVCLCLHQIENNLPRTKFCRKPCRAQEIILERRNSEITKTSKEWYESFLKEIEFVIVDPDGWDRTNYDYSFNIEEITKNEFIERLSKSTIIKK